MKKKILSLVLCGAMAAAMTACGSNSNAAPAAAPAAEPAAEAAAEPAAEAAAEPAAETAAEPAADNSAAGTTITVMASQDWVEDAEHDLGKKRYPREVVDVRAVDADGDVVVFLDSFFVHMKLVTHYLYVITVVFR